MHKLIAGATLVILIAIGVAAQKSKSWGDWSKKDAEKILNDSPWGQTQTETDTSQMFYSPTSDPSRGRATSNDSSRSRQGATNTEVNVNFRIRFFSAKPIRQAFVRTIELQNTLTKEQSAGLAAWSNAHTDDWIIVSVSFDSTDQRYGNAA